MVGDFLHSDVGEFQKRAASALGYVGDQQEKEVQLLIVALQDESLEVRARAAVALGNHEEVALHSVPALIQAVQDVNLQVGWMAVISFGQIDPQAIVTIVGDLGSPAHFIEAIQHEESRARETATTILREIAEEISLVEAMVTTLVNGEESVRLRALRVLQALGLETKGVLGALVRAMEDTSSVVSRMARESLLSITGDRS